MDDERVTLEEAAAALGVNLWRLRKAVYREKLPAKRIGSAKRGIWLVTLADVRAYVETHPRPGPPVRKREDDTA